MAKSAQVIDRQRANVTQGNALARSAQQMTIYEKRLIYVAIASISRDQADFVTTDIPVVELERLFGVNTKAIYKIAKETALSLLERTIHIGSDSEGWTAFQWVSRARYVPAHKHPKGLSTIQLTFHEDLKPYLLKLRADFNSIPLLELLSITSFNSARLFEVLHHDSFRGQKTFLTYDIDELKKRIGLEGKYAKFKDFRYVLDRAQADLAANTGLTFSYTGLQQGRSYTQIRIRITPNQATNVGEEMKVVDGVGIERVADDNVLRLCAELTEAGYTQDTLEAIKKYGLERVRNNLSLGQKKAREAGKSATPIRNLGGLIAYMIQHDVASKATEVQRVDARGLTAEKLRELAVLLKEVFEVNLREASEGLGVLLSEDELGELHDIMRVELNKFTISQLDKQNWKGPGYEAVLYTMLYQKRRDLFPEQLQSVSAWAKNEELFAEYSEDERDRIIEEASKLIHLGD